MGLARVAGLQQPHLTALLPAVSPAQVTGVQQQRAMVAAMAQQVCVVLLLTLNPNCSTGCICAAWACLLTAAATSSVTNAALYWSRQVLSHAVYDTFCFPGSAVEVRPEPSGWRRMGASSSAAGQCLWPQAKGISSVPQNLGTMFRYPVRATIHLIRGVSMCGALFMCPPCPTYHLAFKSVWTVMMRSWYVIISMLLILQAHPGWTCC
jgi:hypothetical protein